MRAKGHHTQTPCMVSWGDGARPSKSTSVCLVVDGPNPVRLITLNEVMS